MSAQIQCPECRAWLLEGVFNQPDFAPCPTCGVPLQVEIFPAFFRKTVGGQTAEALIVDSEASCFYHPQKKAVRPCEGCGRFVCALCDCDLHGQHYCPACLETGRSKGKIKSLNQQRMLYDSIALGLAIAPLLIFYFTIITAPMTLFVAIRYWNAPTGILHRTKIRFILAIIIALIEIACWIALFVTIFTHR